MRFFYDKFLRSASMIYFVLLCIFSCRMAYNEYYVQFHKDIKVSYEKEELVYPLGDIVGIYTESKGVFVIDTCEIESSENQFVNPAKDVLREGDYIIEVNGKELKKKEGLVNAVNKSDGKPLQLTVIRGESTFIAEVTPVFGKNGKYMLGVWVKDDLAGVGTITYYTEEGNFAALGHGMGDGVTKEIWSIEDGDIYFADIVGIQKGKKGTPGEVKGIIYYGAGNHLGEIHNNCGEGIFGILDNEDLEQYVRECEAFPLGSRHEIEIGPAQIISDISGQREIYDIKIEYVDYLAMSSNKGLHIEVTDYDLLELTGGIVQGMSGSPIIQDGKLVGAVTHVLINDPTRGYGIFIDEMTEEKY